MQKRGNKSRRFIDLSGRRFGNLVVREYLEHRENMSYWTCDCDCGKSCTKSATVLKRPSAHDCGCSRIAAGELRKQYPLEYKSWQSMRSRCLNDRDEHFPNYGGRGIAICDRWTPRDSFAQFIADVGRKPSREHTLDRINVDGPYSPENCRWATPAEQANNRRDNVRITIDGVTRTAYQWARSLNLCQSTVSKRIAFGWTPEAAASTPSKKRRA